MFGTKSGKVYCCGDSSQGQCGTLEQAHYNTPICVATFSSPVKKVSFRALLQYSRLHKHLKCVTKVKLFYILEIQ